ncbi:PREDICTED: F-box/LRR-repeat protein 2-like [Priapulus caudatus]|uniref:F-box/LRR-repeat protein 2-like n=1 Tax=Priapulus caudatus TaxID=37621 RepID=A0ABM1F222_PRICU|nr:PREDICTED: F-box/LRR-repeat protein 2-like [Priapulus caudatus]
MIRGCPQLLTIDISWTDISDAGLQALSKGCPRLRAIIAKGCHSITDEGLRWVGQHCRDLRLLNLHSCYKMNQTRGFGDEGVLHVSNGCHQMEFLCLAGCANLTDSSLLALSQGCPKLRTHRGRWMLTRIPGNCGELRRMDLEECVLISDAALLHLAAGCPKLQRLTVAMVQNHSYVLHNIEI